MCTKLYAKGSLTKLCLIIIMNCSIYTQLYFKVDKYIIENFVNFLVTSLHKIVVKYTRTLLALFLS